MSGYCGGCGTLHEEDDNRLCARCAAGMPAQPCMHIVKPRPLAVPAHDAVDPDAPIKCGTFGGVTIPPDVRARMDADRAAAEVAAPEPADDDLRCEGCDAPATCRDPEHVPLCRPCAETCRKPTSRRPLRPRGPGEAPGTPGTFEAGPPPPRPPTPPTPSCAKGVDRG